MGLKVVNKWPSHHSKSSPFTGIDNWTFSSPLSQLYLCVHFLNANWSQPARQEHIQYSIVQCDRAFLGQVAALRVTRHFWHVDGCSPAAAEHLCSQRLAVRISAVQLPCSSQLTNLGLLDLFAPISIFNLFSHTLPVRTRDYTLLPSTSWCKI